MKTNDNSKTSPKIKLSKTFFNIASGQANASEVAAKKRAEKEAVIRGLKRLDMLSPLLDQCATDEGSLLFYQGDQFDMASTRCGSALKDWPLTRTKLGRWCRLCWIASRQPSL